MFRRTVLFAIAATPLAAAPLPGLADSRTLELVESGYEAVLADVEFPGNTAGTLIVRMCASCDPIALRVSSATVYVGTDGRAVPLEGFRERVAELRQSAGANQSTGVGIFYVPDSNRVTRVSLHLGTFRQ